MEVSTSFDGKLEKMIPRKIGNSGVVEKNSSADEHEESVFMTRIFWGG